MESKSRKTYNAEDIKAKIAKNTYVQEIRDKILKKKARFSMFP